MPSPDNECAQLRSRIARLEQELADMQRLLGEAQAERDQYRHYVHDQIKAQFTPEQLRAFEEPVDEENCQQLKDFIHELDEIVKRAKPA